MSAIHLLGGGRDAASLYRRFIADCPTERPRIATVLIDEGNGANDVVRFVDSLHDAGDCEALPLLIPIGDAFDAALLDGADGLFICGGLTPAYADSIAPAATAIRDWLAVDGHAYGGFSAGAAIASGRAVVGGWQLDGVPICHEDTGEDLDELSIVNGLDLVQFAVDVHCGTWGTLSRLSAAVESGAVHAGVGIDENTMLSVDGDAAVVSGTGRVWLVMQDERGLRTRLLTAGGRFDVSALSP